MKDCINMTILEERWTKMSIHFSKTISEIMIVGVPSPCYDIGSMESDNSNIGPYLPYKWKFQDRAINALVKILI